MPNMLSSLVETQHNAVLIQLHTSEAPTDAEWNTCLALGEQYGKKQNGSFSSLRVLAITDGGAPTTLQRGKLNDVMDGQTVLVSTVSSNSMVRGVVTALSWFNRGIRVFSPAQITSALDHLLLTEAERKLVFADIAVLQPKLSAATPRVILQLDRQRLLASRR
jgi:hypothetical protein